MKSIASSIPLLALALLLALPSASHAQVAGAPPTIDYQGQVLDSAGAILAPTTPTNYTMQFRIYNLQTGGSIVWAESQIVTVDKGAFSVRLGQGVPIPAGGGGNEGTTSDLRQAFNATDRFLGLTVVIPPAAPAEITPRLAFLSSPFALVAERAKLADAATTATLATTASSVTQASGTSTLGNATVINLTVSTSAKVNGANVLEFGAGLTKEVNAGKIGYGAFTTGALDIIGAGTTGLNRKIHLFAEGGLTIDGPVTATGAVTASSFAGAGSALTSLNASNLGSGTVPDARIGATIVRNNSAPTFTAVTVNDFTLNGLGKVNGANLLEFGAGVVGKEANAGRIGYAPYTPGTLEIVGAGTTDTNRKIRLYTEGGLTVDGPVTTTGFVGIGTTSPVVPLHVAGSVNRNFTSGNLFDGPGIGGAAGNKPVSIKADQYVEARGYITNSDGRIKDIVKRSDSREALQTLQKLRVTDYRLKDRAADDAGVQRGFIAQEVQTLMPDAVAKGPGFIPDIYAVAEVQEFAEKTGTVRLRLEKIHGLKAGDVVRLITDQGALDQAVVEVVDEHTILIGGTKSAPKHVFVYGRQVDDFLSVDYNRVFTTGIAAIQGLKTEKDAENKALTERNTALAQQLAATEKRLAALEAQVTRLAVAAEKPAIKTASVR